MLNLHLLAAGGGHDPKDHVLPHALAPILKTNLSLPLFKDQATEFWFTNHLLMTLVAATLTLLIFVWIGRRYRVAMAGVPVSESVPRGFAGLIEATMDGLRTGVVRPVLGGDTDRFMPFLWTVFFFILINNLLGMIPFAAFLKLTIHKEHLGGVATGNINITGGLALCAFSAIHVSGIFEVYRGLVAGTYGHHPDHEKSEEGEEHDAGRVSGHGTERASPAFAAVAAPLFYIWNFAPHVFAKEGPRSRPSAGLRVVMLPLYTLLLAVELSLLFMMIVGGAEGARLGAWTGAVLGVIASFSAGGVHPLDFADALMWAFLFLLECIGAIVKPFALCMRLFANMIAGHIVLASILLLIPAFKGFTAAYLGVSIPIVIGCTLLSGLELFVAFLQAYIFMFLTTMFISAAVHPEH